MHEKTILLFLDFYFIIYLLKKKLRFLQRLNIQHIIRQTPHFPMRWTKAEDDKTLQSNLVI